MKLKFKIFHAVRKVLLALALIVTSLILIGSIWVPELLPTSLSSTLWKANSIIIFIVMIVRPLSDLFPSQKWMRFLVPLRKELGILTASIVLSFGLARYINWGFNDFLTTYFSFEYWDPRQISFFGRLGELVAIPLLLTSNNWSLRKLGRWWKRIQRLSYVYFFSGAYYVYAALGAQIDLWFMIIVSLLTSAAWLKKKHKLKKNPAN